MAFLREKWRAAVSYSSSIQLRILLPQNHTTYTRTVVSLTFVLASTGVQLGKGQGSTMLLHPVCRSCLRTKPRGGRTDSSHLVDLEETRQTERKALSYQQWRLSTLRSMRSQECHGWPSSPGSDSLTPDLRYMKPVRTKKEY